MESLYKFQGHLFRKYMVFFVVLVGGALLASRLSEVYIVDAMLRTAMLLILGLVLSVLASLVVARELAEVHAELTEALAQQTAISDILRVISSAPAGLQAVLEAVVDNAARLCNATDAHIFRIDADVLRLVASFGSQPIIGAQESIPLSRDSAIGRAMVDRQTMH